MPLHPVGPSSYGSLRGTTQYVTDAATAAQVNALIEESKTEPAFGDAVLSVNEGNRSRPRQRQLRTAYEAYRAGRGPWAALAAILYTSTHDESRGNGIDFGVTYPDGSNRALTAAQHSWLVNRGRLRGLIWTGREFETPESWHFNGDGSRAVIAPTAAPAAHIVKELERIMANGDSYTVYNRAGSGINFVAGNGHYLAIGSTLTQETGLDGQRVIDVLRADGATYRVVDPADYDALNVLNARIAGVSAA